MTWNPIRARLKENSLIHPATLRSGTFCTRISPGCTHCYASTINKRFGNGLEFTVPNLEKIEFFIDERILARAAEAEEAVHHLRRRHVRFVPRGDSRRFDRRKCCRIACETPAAHLSIVD